MAAERVGDLLVGVAVAGVGHRLLARGRCGGVVGVLRVDAEEGDPLAVAGRELLQGRELVAAGDAPGGPDVGDDRVAAQRRDPLLVGVGAARQQLVAPARAGRPGAPASRRGPWRSRGARRRRRRREEPQPPPPRSDRQARARAAPAEGVSRSVIRSVGTIRTFGSRFAEPLRSPGERESTSRSLVHLSPAVCLVSRRGRNPEAFYGQDQRRCRASGSSFKRRHRACGGVRARALPARRRGARGAGAGDRAPPRPRRGAEGARRRAPRTPRSSGAATSRCCSGWSASSPTNRRSCATAPN